MAAALSFLTALYLLLLLLLPALLLLRAAAALPAAVTLPKTRPRGPGLRFKLQEQVQQQASPRARCREAGLRLAIEATATAARFGESGTSQSWHTYEQMGLT